MTAEPRKPEQDQERTDDASGRGQPDAERADEILDAIHRNDFLSAVLDERDISLVYISRDRIYNYVSGTGSTHAHPVHVVDGGRVHAGAQAANQVSHWEIDQARATYHAPPAYAHARRRFLETGFVILCGKPGAGKRATALNLLSAISFDGRATPPIYELNPALRLADMPSDQLPDKAGLLLEAADADCLAGLESFHVNRLQTELNPGTSVGRGLVVVVDQLPASFPIEHRHLVLEWSLDWPEGVQKAQRATLAAHIRYLARREPGAGDELEAQIEDLLNKDEVRRLLDEPLAMGQLAELADLVMSAVQDGQPLEQALARFDQYAHRDVQHWFDTEHPPDAEELLIAAAVFNGAAYEDVTAAARRLGELARPDSAREGLSERRPAAEAGRFRSVDHRQARLQSIRARLETALESAHFGEVALEAVRLENPGWQEAVLRYVWGFDAFHDPLLAWLDEYAGHRRHSLRARAAAAVGALACMAFAAVEERMLRPWANSPNGEHRRSAAQALGITIWDDMVGPATARLLHYWASQSGNPRYQWTAAVAYSGLAGLRFPRQTLDDLKLIARQCSRHPELLLPIFRSLINAYAAADTLPERRIQLLRELEAWCTQEVGRKEAKDEVISIQRTGLLSFWVILWPARRDPVWRQLLADIGIPGEMQKLAVDLIRRSLRFRQPKGSVRDNLHPRNLARDGLHALALHVARAGDDDSVHYVEGLYRAVLDACSQDPVDGADELDRLHYYALDWNTHESDASRFLRIFQSANP